jgi:type I restriction enzyme S subunit
MTTQNKNVPALRFPDFQGEWQSKKLEQISTKISDGIHSTPQYDESGEYYFVNGNNLVDGKVLIFENTKKVNETEYLKHKKELNNKTILLSINGTIGSLALFNKEKIILGKSACYINLDGTADKMFIYNILQTSTVVNFFTSELTGSTIKNLSLATVKNCNLYLPTLPEQQKIAAFLTAVDEKIQQLIKKKDLLEQYKKGVMQKIFNQEVRFKDDNGNDFADWEEKLLGEASEINPKNKALPESFIYIDLESVENGVLQKESLVHLKDAPSRAQRLLEKNDILFQTVRPYQRNNLYFDKDGVYVASTGYAQIRTKNNPKYLYQLLHSDGFVNEVILRCTGTGYPAINSTDLSNIQINLPTHPEQERIADFLSAFDTKINLVKIQLEQTQQYKKGLLQKMFV